MTVPLAPDSPRRATARRFSGELVKAMRARRASVKRLAEASGCAPSALNAWRSGQNLPRPATAARLAEVLDWPRLVAIATEGRTRPCDRCKRTFVDMAGGNRRFCSDECRLVDAQMRSPRAGSALAASVREAVDSRLAGAPERDTLPAIMGALRAYEGGEARRVARVDQAQRQVAGLQGAIAAMCAGCEPEGLCQTPECPLRVYSPLPLASERSTTTLREASSPHAPEHREQWLASVRRGNAERWSRDGERERQSERSIERWASMDPDEREAVGARISAGRRLA